MGVDNNVGVASCAGAAIELKEKLAEASPAPNPSKFRRIAKYAFITCFILFAAAIIDILVFSMTLNSFSVQDAQLWLQDSSADAVLNVQASLNLNSVLHSYDLQRATCRVQYSDEGLSKLRPLTNVEIAVERLDQLDDRIAIEARVLNTDYPSLRRLAWDLLAGAGPDTYYSMQCSGDYVINAYRFIPVPVKNIMFTDKRQLPEVSWDFFSSNMYSNDVKVKSSSRRHFKMKLDLTFPVPVTSFVVNIPETSFALSAMSNTSDITRWVLRMAPFDIDLTAKKLVIDYDTFSLYCEGPHGEDISEDRARCNVLDPRYTNDFLDRFKRGEVEVTADAKQSHFITNYMGQNHFLRVSTSSANHKSFHRLLSGSDPSISDGGDCINVNADNVYDSRMCSFIEAGFFKLLLDVQNDDGVLVKLNSLTSWATEGAFAANSYNSFEVSGGSTGFANLEMSDNFKNASLEMQYVEDSVLQLEGSITTAWSFDDASSGELEVTGNVLNYISEYFTLSTKGFVSYIDNAYFVSYNRSMEGSDSSGVIQASGWGGFGGDFYSWWLSLEESHVKYNGEVVSRPEGKWVYEVPSGGITGDLSGYALDNAGKNNPQYYSNSSLKWALTESGFVDVDSYVNVLDDVIWDAGCLFEYGDNAYSLLLEEYAGEDKTEEHLFGTAIGGYGGSFYSWWWSLDESLLRISGSVYGDATARLASDVSATGNVADFLAQCDIHDGTEREVFHYNSSVSWDVPTYQEGHVSMSSDMRMYTNPIVDDVNTSYCEPYEAYNTNYANINTTICYITACPGQTIKASMCSGWCDGDTYLNLYDSSGNFVASNDDRCGLCSEIVYETNIDSCEVFALHQGCFSTQSCGGQVAYEVYNSSAAMWDPYMHITWNVVGSLNYENSAYDFLFQEHNYEGYENFNITGSGAYGGDFYDWWWSLDESVLRMYASDVGSATARIDYTVPADGMSGHLHLAADAKDSSAVEVMFTDSRGRWDVSSSDGSLDLTSVLRVSGLDWNVTGAMDYGSNAYSLMANDLSLVGDELFYVMGEGGYGGNVYAWWWSLDESLLRISGSVYGDATARLASDVSSTGNVADFLAQCDIHDGTEREVFHYNSSVSWDVPTYQEGHVSMSSDMRTYTKTKTTDEVNAVVYYCEPYAAANTNYATVNTAICYITACSGQMIKASMCSGWCDGDTYLNLYDSTGNFVAANDDRCGLCSEIVYETNIDSCEVFALHQGCYGTDSCSGQVAYEVYNKSGSTTVTYTPFAWNVMGSLHYENSAYDFLFQERNYDGYENFNLTGSGAYGGDFYDWWWSLDESVLRMYASDVGSATARIDYTVPADGMSGDLHLAADAKDGSAVEVMFTDSRGRWDVSNSDGSLDLVSVFRVSGLDWNVTGAMNYGSNAYSVMVNDLSLDGDDLFYVIGEGGYGGNEYAWWWSLDESVLRMYASDVGSATARIDYTVPADGMSGDLHLAADAKDGSAVEVMFTDSRGRWDVSSSDGSLDLVSVFRVSGLDWNVTGAMDYGSNAYSVMANDLSLDGDELFYVIGEGGYGGSAYTWWWSLDESLLRISGSVYGDATARLASDVSTTGNVADFLAQCDIHDGTEREVFHYNSSVSWDVPTYQEGHVSMSSDMRMYTNPIVDFSYCEPYEAYNTNYANINTTICYIRACPGQTIKASMCSGWCDGDTYLRLFDSNDTAVASNDDRCGLCSEIVYETNIDSCEVFALHQGCFSTQSCSGQVAYEVYNSSAAMWDPYMQVTWNVVGSLNYENSAYDFLFQEHNYEGYENFFLNGTGKYFVPNSYEWWVSLEESELRLYESVVTRASGILNVDIKASDGSEGMISALATAVDASNEEQLYTHNKVSWSGYSENVGGTCHTENRWYGDNVFELTSILSVNLNEETARFYVSEKSYDEEQLLCSATAFYDMSTGMMTGIGMTTYWQGTLLFDADLFWDAQLEDYIEKTPEPTGAPTKKGATTHPTMHPTALPSVAPTVLPTVAPTMLPTRSPTTVPTRQPTRSPTRDPTTSPSMFPTSVAPSPLPSGFPTALPTREPTTLPPIFPTVLPTVAPTALPSSVPTASPTRQPTISPSIFPTVSPTVAPSALPSRFPTASPTRQPTRNPTLVPTHRPSHSPTFAPTFSMAVVIEYSQGIANVTAEAFLNDADAKQAFIEAVAEAVQGLQPSDITINFAYDTIIATGEFATQRLLAEDAPHTTVDYSIDALLSSLGQMNPIDAVNYATTQLVNSVSSGNFTENMISNSIALHSNTLTKATAEVPDMVAYETIVNSPAPTPAPSRDTHHKSGESGGLSDSDTNTVIISATVIGGAIVVAAAVFIFMYVGKTKTATAERTYNVEMNVRVDPTASSETRKDDTSPSAPPDPTATPAREGAFHGDTTELETIKIEEMV